MNILVISTTRLDCNRHGCLVPVDPLTKKDIYVVRLIIELLYVLTVFAVEDVLNCDLTQTHNMLKS